MSYLIILRLRRAAILPVLALGLILAACSGSGDATGPDPDFPGQPAPPQVPGPPQAPPPPPAPPPEIPGPTQPIVAGTYGLTAINESQPGQLVTVANPDGGVIGLYRFMAVTRLVLSPLQSWSLELHYGDDKTDFVLTDGGDFTWSDGGDGLVLNLESDVYGDAFVGKAQNGLAAIRYDMDGDGELDTTFVFEKIGD